MQDRSRSPTKARETSSFSSKSDNSLQRARTLAVEAVLHACRLCSETQVRLVSDDVVSKKDRSPVTVADLGAQAIVSSLLSDAFPEIPLVGEEDAQVMRDDAELASKVFRSVRNIRSELTEEQVMQAIDRGIHEGGKGLFWVLDPIDGTKGFLRREQYAVCLGLIENGQVLVAVLGCPNLPVDPAKPDGEVGCLFIAVHGQGASQYDIATGAQRNISVSTVSDSCEASFVESVEAAHADHSKQARLAAALGISKPCERMDSQCKFGVVARGQASLYLRFAPERDYEQKIWDIAVGAKIIEEAGGTVSDATGSRLNFTLGRTIGTGSLFASNTKLHPLVLEAIKSLAA